MNTTNTQKPKTTILGRIMGWGFNLLFILAMVVIVHEAIHGPINETPPAAETSSSVTK